MLNRPHPGPLPQERETHSPLTGHIGVLGCRAPSETNGKEAATATATNKLSGSIGSFPLPLNRTECARPRAQKDAMVRRHQNIPKLSLLLTLLRPGTGALRFRGSKRKNAFRQLPLPALRGEGVAVNVVVGPPLQARCYATSRGRSFAFSRVCESE